MSALIRGGSVRPHVQAFADALQTATGVTSFGTYPGHEPSIDLAIDVFHAIGDNGTADRICAFGLRSDVYEPYGVDYLISRQRIYNAKIANYWRPMADRGSPTQNHLDHVHFSFEPTAAPHPPQPPQPPDTTEVPDMVLIWHKGALYLVADGKRSAYGLQPVAADALKAGGVKVGGNPADDQSNLFGALGVFA